tara:strand:+ start:1090 stop:1767 length:678 start_codon:yes stop_codon:yes gene_type:complete
MIIMSMRSQVYEWDASRGTPAQGVQAGQRISIFIGGFGNNITKPAETTATEFVVIEDIAVSPSLPIGINAQIAANSAVRGLTYADDTSGVAGGRAYVQVRINTTDYFLDPDNVPNDGIPGTASPYPRSINFQPSFNLYPDVYVLPGQVWDVLVTFYNAEGLLFGAAAGTPTGTTNIDAGQLQCFTKYTLYDGPDALIANKLLEMGISINPGNVDWYKRSLLASQA